MLKADDKIERRAEALGVSSRFLKDRSPDIAYGQNPGATGCDFYPDSLVDRFAKWRDATSRMRLSIKMFFLFDEHIRSSHHSCHFIMVRNDLQRSTSACDDAPSRRDVLVMPTTLESAHLGRPVVKHLGLYLKFKAT